MPRIRNERNESIDTLFRAILSLENLDECYRFFGDLLTVQEVSAFAQRLQVDRASFITGQVLRVDGGMVI